MKVLSGSPLSPKMSVSVPRLNLELAAVLHGWGFLNWKIRLGMMKKCIDLLNLAGIYLLINSPPNPPIILENQNHLNSAIQKYVLVQNLLQYLYLFFYLQMKQSEEMLGTTEFLYCNFFSWTFQLGTHILFLLRPLKQCFSLEMQSNVKINCLSSTV